MWEYADMQRIIRTSPILWIFMAYWSRIICSSSQYFYSKAAWAIRKSLGWKRWVIWLKSMNHLDENYSGSTDPLVGAYQVLWVCLAFSQIEFSLSIFGFLFKFVWTWKSKVLNIEMKESGTKAKVSRRSFHIFIFRKHASWGLGTCANLKGCWPIAKAIRTTIPMLMTVSKLCKTLKDGVLDHFWCKDRFVQCCSRSFHWIPTGPVLASYPLFGIDADICTLWIWWA